MSALDTQEGGGHYKGCAIQPVEYIHANGIGYMEGNVIKYVTRWRAKGGLDDLRKARHYIELLIELEEGGQAGQVKRDAITPAHHEDASHDQPNSAPASAGAASPGENTNARTRP